MRVAPYQSRGKRLILRWCPQRDFDTPCGVQVRGIELAAYIVRYVALQDVRVAPGERFGRPELGAFATLVNRGTRTLNKVRVRIYFLDSSGRRIGEKDFPAVFVSRRGRCALCVRLEGVAHRGRRRRAHV
jgi:hypothetical protein